MRVTHSGAWWRGRARGAFSAGVVVLARRPRGALAAGVVVLAPALAAAELLAAPSAQASRGQLAIFQDDRGLFSQPRQTLQTLRRLGVGVVRVSLRWNEVAPEPAAEQPPPGFRGADPASYPVRAWARYDSIARLAKRDGIRADFVLTGPAPLWASGTGAPQSAGPFPEWRPSARGFGEFVEAVGRRYSGASTPSDASSPLPRVGFWEIWNEPNFGLDLAPQATHGSAVSTGPGMYRRLLNAAWGALLATGHRRDTILIGGLSPRGFQAPVTRRWPQGLPGNFSTTKPLRFIRTLYCADGRFAPLRGSAATAAGCPRTAAGSARFPAANPALFGAAGFGIHPYPYNTPPPRADSPDPDYVEFSEIPRLARTLDRLLSRYGSSRRLPIYNTEYGYITSPPKRDGNFVSPTTAAFYMNWAEYLSWRDQRLVSTMQYQLADPDPTAQVPEFGGFASGLMFSDDRHKAGYAAYRMPVFLPVTSFRRSQAQTVWGCVRPAARARKDTHGRAQAVAIQFRGGPRGPFRTLTRITITDPRSYFEVNMKFPGSGEVRLAWTYPDGEIVVSRRVRVRVRR